jgi:WhiB family redox-sensing transcriptional regulator
MTDETWRERGQCVVENADPDLFIPPFGESKSDLVKRNKAALAICARCEVKAPCLEFALRMGEDGIWGGTTGRQRRAMRETAVTHAQ